MIVDIVNIQKFNDSDLGECLLVKTNPIIDSPFGIGGCRDLTRVIKFLYPQTENNIHFLQKAKDDENEYFEAHESAFKWMITDVGSCYVHNSFFEKESKTSSIGKAIDLGLSVLWADMNVGATSETSYGKLFGYGDTSGNKTSENESEYPNENIVNTEFDIAKNNWGDNWRMPTSDELEELAEKCRWTPHTKNGIQGNLVTGPNGNSIFFPFAGVRMGIDTFRRGQIGQCWSGSMSKFGGFVELLFFGYSATVNYGGSASNGNSVRPVKDK